MLMAQGRIIYFNEARLSVDYFASIDYKCPELSNPADFFMSMMSIESQELEDTEDKNELIRSQTQIFTEYSKRIDYFHSNYQNSNLRNDHTF